MFRIPLLSFALTLTACGAQEQPEPTPPTATEGELYTRITKRLVENHVDDHGQVVSLRKEGEGTRPDRLGDSWFMSGVAVATLDCAKANELAEAHADLILQKDGRIDRHDPLKVCDGPGCDSKTWYSFDQEIGYLYGLARLVGRCGAPAQKVVDAFDAHDRYIERNRGRLHEDPSVDAMPPEFTFLHDAVAHSFNRGGRPHPDRLITLGKQISTWNFGTKTGRAACFRANLGWMTMRGIEGLGYAFAAPSKGIMCESSAGMELPHWDHSCGRGGLQAWLDGFELNRYEFALQRCYWESPDGAPDLATPGVDYLVAFREQHGG